MIILWDEDRKRKRKLMRGGLGKEQELLARERGIQGGSEKEAGDLGMSGGPGKKNFGLSFGDCTWFPARMSLALPSIGAWGTRLAGLRGITGWNANAALCIQLSELNSTADSVPAFDLLPRGLNPQMYRNVLKSVLCSKLLRVLYFRHLIVKEG